MDEDDDAFLYGDSSEAAPAAENTPTSAQPLHDTKQHPAEQGQTPGHDGNQVSLGVNNELGGSGGEDAAEEEEEEEEEDDSDSDLEIIVDSSAAEVRPQPPYAQRPLQPFNKSLQTQRAPASAITSEYTPRQRPGQTSTAASSLAVAMGLGEDTQSPTVQAASVTQQPPQQQLHAELPEGPPPHAPSTAPRIDLDPAEHNLLVPPETVDDEPGPVIYHIDPLEMEEKPWRRPGADLTDYFNYGFDEDSWRAWAAKKTNRTMERHEMQHNAEKGSLAEREDSTVAQPAPEEQYSNIPAQQVQAMQSMMAASGMSMPPEQFMAFMGLGPGGMPGMMNMSGMGGMAGGMGNNMFPMSQQLPPIHFGQSQQQHNHHQPQQQQLHSQQMNTPSMTTPRPGTNGLPERPAFDSPMPGEEHAAKVENMEDGNRSPQPGDGSNGHIDVADMSTTESNIPTGPSASQDDESKGSAPAPSAMPPQGQAGPDAQASGRGQRAASGGFVAGRGAGVPGAPTGPSRGAPPKGPAADRNATVSGNVPTGPKNPGRRYNDRDNGMGAADTLDYGGGGGASRDERSDGRHRSVSRGPRSPVPQRRRDSMDESEDALRSSRHSRRPTESDDVRASSYDEQRSHSQSRHMSESFDQRDPDDADSVASSSAAAAKRSRGGRSNRDREREREREREKERERSERRRGGGSSSRGARDGDGSGGEEEPHEDGSSHHRRADKDRSHARSKRRAGNAVDDVDGDAHALEADSSAAASKSERTSRGGGRSRKRTATEDTDAPQSRETRRRR